MERAGLLGAAACDIRSASGTWSCVSRGGEEGGDRGQGGLARVHGGLLSGLLERRDEQRGHGSVLPERGAESEQRAERDEDGGVA